MREGQGKSKEEKKKIKKRTTEHQSYHKKEKIQYISVPPHSSHKTNFITHCVTLTEIKLSNFGVISLTNIRTGEY